MDAAALLRWRKSIFNIEFMNHRLTASKNILDAMTPDEKKILEGKAEAMGGHGLPEDVKRK